MRFNMDFLLSILVVCIIFCGCLSQSVEEEVSSDPLLDCVTTALVSYEPVVGGENSHTVIANVRSIKLNQSSEVLVFTEPILGTFSILEYPCTTNCSYNVFANENFIAPLRLDAADFDGDGKNELILSDIGVLSPSDEKYGKVSILTINNSIIVDEQIVIQDIGRVTCAEAADLDSDSDLDLTLCEFGNTDGSVGWLENHGGGNWTWHKLEDKSGAIEATPVDIDGDGDLDIVSIISQLSEEIVIFWNDGFGNFVQETLFKANNTYFGMSGINIVDYGNDGDKDILFTNGDVLDGDFPSNENFWDYHGLSLLENIGEGKFQYQRLLSFTGAYDSAIFDIDSDGDDEIVVIGFKPSFGGAIFDENDPSPNIGWLDLIDQSWVTVFPTNDIDLPLITLDVMDINGDGEKSLIAGNHDVTNSTDAPKLISISADYDVTCAEN